MSSHLETLGFIADDDPQHMAKYAHLVGRACEEGTRHLWPTGGGLSYAWQPGNGTELWVHLTGAGGGKLDIACMTPVLLPTGPTPFVAERLVEDPQCRHCSGIYVANCGNPPEDHIYYPLLIQLADVVLTEPKIVDGAVLQLEIAGVAETFRTFRNQAHFEAEGKKIHRQGFAVESLIPYGAQESPGNAHSRVFMTGRISSYFRCEGCCGGPPWVLASVRTYAAELECAFPGDAELAVGSIVQGEFWLAAIGSRTN